MKQYLLRGVPASVRMDGWWLDTQGDKRHSRPAAVAGRQWGERLAVLMALIALADLLIWQVVAPGVSLALFGLAVVAAAQLVAGRKGAAGLSITAAFMAPIVEHVQALSLGFWLFGLLIGAAWVSLGRLGIVALLAGAWRFVAAGPAQTMQDIHAGVLGPIKGSDVTVRGRHAALTWGLPIGLGLVFVALLIDANPMLEDLANRLTDFGWMAEFNVTRVMFWAGVGFLLWPFLSLLEMRERMKLGVSLPMPRALPAFFNDASVRRSLVIFNLVFAVQTVTDLAYLWGGVALPDGMSYAEYAHRGAYPLLITALLAGAFAVVTRPFVARDAVMRTVMLVWVAQTVLLVISSLFRLELYIEVYGLTRLRMSAAIWMAMVAAGLVLVGWQVLRNQTAKWMLSRAAAMGFGVLYACCFLSFDGTIARYNLTNDVRLDRVYLCGLGPAALPAIRAYELGDGTISCDMFGAWHGGIADNHAMLTFFDDKDWREWGFRRWRILRSLAAVTPLPEGEPL